MVKNNMDNSALEQIRTAITQNTTIGITVGENPSLDEMAASLGLYLSLKDAQKQVTIAAPNEPRVAVSSLVGIDKVKTTLGSDSGDLIVSFPYREGEIEKISYTLDPGKLNIVVKAGPDGLTFHNKDVTFSRSNGIGPALLFVIGTPTLSKLGKLFDAESLKNTTIVNIDNKRENQGFGDITFISEHASSVSEQVAQIISLLTLPLGVDTAQNLLSGINSATDNFQHPKTSAVAFEMAAVLMKNGAMRKKQVEQTRPVDPFFSQRPAPRSFPTQQNVKTPMQFGSGQYSDPFLDQLSRQNPLPKPQERKQDSSKQPPTDWLTPKIYKGSTQV